MEIENIPVEFKFTTPANYRIYVKGFLDESWSERLLGMTINNQIAHKSVPVTMLYGQVRDQAELLGFLNSLYEMRMSLVSIELLSNEENVTS